MWPRTADNDLGKARHAHSIRYERGPVPFIMVRPNSEWSEGPADAMRGDGMEAVPLWAGSSMPLDCEIDYEVFAPVALYGVADVLRTGTVPSTEQELPCSTMLDTDAPGDPDPGMVNAFWTYTFRADESNAVIVSIPTRGLTKIQLLIMSGTLTGAGTVSSVFSILTDVEGPYTETTAAVLAALSTSNQRAAPVLLGEYNHMPANVLGMTPVVVGGLIDRVRVSHTGTITGESPTFPLFFNFSARVREQR